MNRISICSLLLALAMQYASAPGPALAANAALTGTVLAAGAPVANAQLTATVNNVTLTTRTDAVGRFAFFNLSPGSYVISASGVGGTAQTSGHLGAGGANITLRLDARKLGVISV